MLVMSEIAEQSPEYELDALLFVHSALDYALAHYSQNAPGVSRHLTGAELSEGVRLFAIEQFGEMAYFTLNSWGLKSTYDIGCIVFKMIDKEVFSKQEGDSLDDFRNVYSFKEAFPPHLAFEDYDFPDLPIIDQ